MHKKIIIISTSPRRGGNSEALADAFAKGAAEAGHSIDMVCLHDKQIHFCRGCLACQQTGVCVIKDAAAAIVERMQTADVIVFATPIYFYEMSGQMKTLLDRTNPLFPKEYAFREIYLLAAAADTEEGAIDGAAKGLQGWADCFEKAEVKGMVCGLGADSVGTIKGNPAWKEAYEMGRNV